MSNNIKTSVSNAIALLSDGMDKAKKQELWNDAYGDQLDYLEYLVLEVKDEMEIEYYEVDRYGIVNIYYYV